MHVNQKWTFAFLAVVLPKIWVIRLHNSKETYRYKFTWLSLRSQVAGNKQAGNQTGTDFILFYFYSIKFITVGQGSIFMTAFKLCAQSLVFKDHVFIITLFSSQLCLIKQFLLDLVLGIPYFLE